MKPYLVKNGDVSTENNGGFIQIRRELKNIDLGKAKSIRLYARGNNEKYFIFLRTTGTILMQKIQYFYYIYWWIEWRKYIER